MKIGLDIHYCIDLYPEIFSKLSHQWKEMGHEIHIITGQAWDLCKNTVEECGVIYTHHFSIVDHHREIGTFMWRDDSRGRDWWMDRDVWNQSKGVYAQSVGIDLHFDDSHSYLKHFPNTCTYIIVPPTGFKNISKLFLK